MSTVKSAAMGGAKEALKKVTGHWLFWVIVAVVAAIVIWKVRKKAGTWWRNLKATNTADTSGQSMNAQDVARVKRIAQDLATELPKGWNYDSDRQAAAVQQALALNATDLIFLAKEYRTYRDGTTLLEDLDNETFNTDEERRLMARLNEIGVAKMAVPRIEVPEPESTASEYPTTMTYDK